MKTHRIRERRLQRGWSQAQMAERAGLSNQAYVSKAETQPDKVPSYVRAIRMVFVEERRRREALRVENARKAALEALWLAVPASPEKDRLRAAMVDRALDHLTDGEAEAFDAIIDFIPYDECKDALDAWLAPPSVGLVDKAEERAI